MNLIQVVSLVFSLFALSRVVLRLKDKKITIGEFVFWTLIWVSLIIVVFFPHISSVIAGFVGIGRGVDAIIYTSIALLFYLIFRIYVKLEETEQEITKVVREIALIKRKK